MIVAAVVVAIIATLAPSPANAAALPAFNSTFKFHASLVGSTKFHSTDGKIMLSVNWADDSPRNDYMWLTIGVYGCGSTGCGYTPARPYWIEPVGVSPPLMITGLPAGQLALMFLRKDASKPGYARGTVSVS